MIRFSPKTPEPEETKTPEPEVPKTPEPEPRNDYSASQQKIFEEIHEKLVYDTIEEKLSNLIDVEAGVGETKEMKITLEKTMSFQFQVHSANTEVVREAVEGLEDHFEKILNYKVGLVIRDSGGFTKEVHATKKT